ncbi:Na(+)/H(+) antiporter subunit C [Streptomyces sp. cg28]|uniref:Na(+)/H(+) antiporter subunit C n=1 Tax=unclassified Streptomyces TaxID=2593676 RepID=UPI000DBA4E83|nr:Na(+)/H(+) antiporter subunit C [Streptomyces sp. PsTaAH-137]MYT75412.1 Na(+)/H(+) antiporter subunit C [Streptomyces sp. SID8367]RAJ86814.1 multisubunit sodium/proton antiporter MrpC subunit [Streptomyces sp. PsTaAH-137]
MTVSATLLVCGIVLVAAGGMLILTRSLTRVLIGIIVCGNGVNLFVLASAGRAGLPPLLYPGVSHARVTDPLPQAIVLTAVVITLATTAFVLAMAYRSSQLTGSDFVPDDIADRRVVLRAQIAEERHELREQHREEGKRAWREERREQRHRIRADRAFQARARDSSGDLWDDVLGTDPEETR